MDKCQNSVLMMKIQLACSSSIPRLWASRVKALMGYRPKIRTCALRRVFKGASNPSCYINNRYPISVQFFYYDANEFVTIWTMAGILVSSEGKRRLFYRMVS